MDPKHPTAAAAAAATSVAATDSPDTDGNAEAEAETETTLHHSDRIKPFSFFPNGKDHHYHQFHHQQQPPSAVVAYRECLKNHAATIGSHALDGCGEFMPPLTCSTPLEPAALTCAACGCHRNFHRREHITDVDAYSPHLLLSFSPHDHVSDMKIENPNGRKRFRTKFSQDQKEKMYLFAEKVGWKMQRCDDKLVADFCNEVGIKRGIFKVWMHNNKNTFGKKDKDTPSPTTTTSAGTATAVTAAVTTAVTAVTGVCMDSSDGYNNGRVVKREGGNAGGCDNSNSSDQENGGGSGGGGGGHGGGHGGGGGGGVHLHGCNNGSCSSC